MQCLTLFKKTYGSELITSNDHFMTYMCFKPLRYYSPCQVYTTRRTITTIQLLIIVRTSYEPNLTLFVN